MKKVSYALLPLPLVIVLACSQSVNEHPSPPVNEQYKLEFPSTAAAVAAETVQVFVFDGAITGNDCGSLLLKRKSNSELPASLATSDVAPICDVFSTQNNDGGVKATVPNVGFGQRSFLAVTQRSGKDFFVGCGTANVTAESAPVEIQLGPANAQVTVPATNCTLTTKCAGSCS